MFCQHCGAALAADGPVCAGCGTAVPSRVDVAGQIKAVSADALGAFKNFAVNPVGGLHAAYQTLGPRRAMLTGIAFGIVYDLCAIVGSYVMARRSFGAFGGFYEMTVKTLFKLAILGCVPLLAFVGASFVTRKIFRGAGSIEGDFFLSGAALLPAAFLFIAAAIVGVGNFEVVIVLSVFALCYTILLLFTGATRISGLNEAAAVPAVALMLIVTMWIVKVVVTAVMF